MKNKKIQYMKIKILTVVFSPGVYLAGNSNAPKIVYLPHPLFLLGVQFLHKNKLKSEIFYTKKL